MKNLSLKQQILLALLVLCLIGAIVAWPFSTDIYKNAKTLQDDNGSQGIGLYDAMRMVEPGS